ncbi:outer membrane protein [Legionella fallonii]|uniref:Outer membrane protein beta-barrel domain-containing protein n=1 Tax=Legionella fallonii LLAP-10 TaxID=1212491 RepID=A0A098G462_9GAMM|nr:outer membrane beta-barrel protein [Legionella fallonii]CEG56270.1 conserved exported protein of unknown function [Legionella fallonii LLAP-10]
MLIRNPVLGLAAVMLGTSLAYAGDMGTIRSSYRPVGSVFGGVANLSSRPGSYSFLGTDDDVFVYNGVNSSKTTGLVGVFLGVEPTLSYTNFFLQAGLEYSYFGNTSLYGSNTVGIEPETSTAYQYQYTLQTQQLLAVGKFFKKTHFPKTNHILYPYLSIGLGVAFNQAKNYQAFTNETGSINITPSFADHSNTSFSYSLGVGIDSPIDQHIRIGVGYKFSDFLRANLGNGQVVINQYAYPVLFSLKNTHTYANQFIAQISYVV